jgi:bifunctional non-homologous end joining protein LigD
MALKTYNEKRNFKQTPEPSGKKKVSTNELKFVIQRHDASHLHYDFRLEMEGVLKSWAVPKGPSLNPHDKRLAMMVEDHPFEYRTFQGVIPEGNYGAGIVEIWDEGTYTAIGSTDRKESEKMLLSELKKGSLKFVLHGKKLKGEFALVKIKNTNASKDNAWLLIKHNDEYATEDLYNSEEDVPTNSKIIKKNVVSKKSSKIATKKAVEKKVIQKEVIDTSIPTSKKKVHSVQSKIKQGKAPMLHDVKPMLAKLKDEPFDSPEWIYEIKWDGYRAIAEVSDGNVQLYSRNHISFNQKFEPIIDALELLEHNVVLDGEVVVMNTDGTTSFQLLQQYAEHPSPNLCYVIFDILFIDGHDLRVLPLLERKKILQQILPETQILKYSDHIDEDGIHFFELAKKNKLEGIMAKKSDSQYHEETRSSEWLKIKVVNAQEAVICGFTAPRNSRKDFGALILGVYKKNKLIYIGHTGSGFTTENLTSIRTLLDPLIQKVSPFEEIIKTNEKVTWLKPKYVCEVSFTEWTSEGHLRHPIFKGLREDKKPNEVFREEMPSTKEKNSELQIASTRSLKFKSTKKIHPTVPSIKKNRKNDSEEKKVDGHTLSFSNVSKVYWPQEQFTKGDLIEYYTKIADYMLPYLKDRPESLNRHPNGIDGEHFFQKDMGDQIPSWIKTKEIHSESNDKNIRYLLCQNKATLLYMANLGCIEINPWNARIQKIDKPDYIIIDLDPGENTFDDVIHTALITKKILDKAGINGYCKTSGASGLHIYIPLGAKYTFEQGKNFAHVIVQLVHEQLPELTSLERSTKERKKKIYLDYLQNRSGQTIAAPYSVRPKEGATVSTPLEWKEVKKGLHPSQFTIKTIFKRLEQKGDLFKGVLGKGINMASCLKKLDN